MNFIGNERDRNCSLGEFDDIARLITDFEIACCCRRRWRGLDILAFVLTPVPPFCNFAALDVMAFADVGRGFGSSCRD